MDYVWRLLSQPRSPGQDGYFEHVRSELLDLLTEPPGRFVEIGCGTGGTGAEVKRRFPNAIVDGFEFDPAAAAIAATRLDTVHCGDVTQADLAGLYAPGSIDALLLADVLEHLYDPWQLLLRLHPLLAPMAQIIASIPNARNLALLTGLAAGRFSYERAGLLDITHIRFFTRTEILRMFDETGYDVRSIANVRDPNIAPLSADSFPVTLETAGITFKDVDANAFVELQTIQFYVTARPRLGA